MELFGKKILITGGNGFVGKHLAKASVEVMDVQQTKNNHAHRIFTGDLPDKEFVQSIILESKPDIIFHLAAFINRSDTFSDCYKAIDIYLVGSLNLFNALHAERRERSIVVVGTAEEYGGNQCPFKEDMRESPVSAYSFSKLCVSQLCQILNRVHNMPFVTVRPALAYGPGQSCNMFLPSLIVSLLRGQTFPMTEGNQTRDYIYVDDLVEAIVRAALCEQAKGQILNIGSGKPITIGKLAMMVEQLLGIRNLVMKGAIPYRKGEIMDYCVDLNKMRSLLQWETLVSLEKGLKLTIDFYKGQINA